MLSRLLAGSSCIVFVLFSAISVACAQTTGVTEKEILIGSCAALDGPSSFLGRETVRGAEAYFQSINEEGGTNGRKLRLISYDDSYGSRQSAGLLGQARGSKGLRHGAICGHANSCQICPFG